MLTHDVKCHVRVTEISTYFKVDYILNLRNNRCFNTDVEETHQITVYKIKAK